MNRLMTMIVSILVLFSLTSFAKEVTKRGTTAASLLNIDVGARAVGMGGSFVSIANDVSAMYWNSAGIARLTHGQAMFTHTRWIADIMFNYAAIAVPLARIGTIGANATFMTMDEMERTTIANPDGTGETFGAGSYAVGLCYATNLTDHFSVGFNFKYITENIYHSSAHGFAFDVGTLFTTQFSGLTIGMNIANYGTKMRMSGRDLLVQTDIDPQVSGNNANINANLKTDEFDLPLMFRVGVSMDVLKGVGDSHLILSVDALHPNDDVESLNVGGEYVYHDMVALRAGYTSMFARDNEGGLSLGSGFHYRLVGIMLMIDYGYRDFGILNDVQMFSVGIEF